MKKRVFAPIAAILISMTMLLVMFWMLSKDGSDVAGPALAAPMQVSPVVTLVDPVSAPNDLDTPIVITGTGFTAGLSGTLVITQPIAYLEGTVLADVTWISSTTIHATVPWGMDPGVYTLTVVNPDGELGSLADALTVTQGIGVWQTGGPYGGSIDSLVLGDSQGLTIYATVFNVGMFRSRDGGESWELLFIEVGYENRPAVDPNNPDRVYIANTTTLNNAMYLSEDGGDTWTAMPQPIPGMNTRAFLAYVSPHDSSLFGALFADPGGPSCDWDCCLFRFDEADQSWACLVDDGLQFETKAVSTVAFDPEDSQIMYAGLLDGTVIQSTDGGDTWSFHSQTPLDYIKELAVNPVGGELWVCGPGGGLLPGGLYKYNGTGWDSMYDSSSVFPIVRNIVFDKYAEDVDNQHIWIAADDALLISEDGGQNWSYISVLDIGQAIALHPDQPETIYVGTSVGVDKTTDGGASWQPVNEGLTGVVPFYMAVNPLNPAIIYACNVYAYGSQNGGETWQTLDGRCGPIVVDPVNPQHVVIRNYIADDSWNFDREFTVPMPPELDEELYGNQITSMAAVSDTWLMGVGYYQRLPYMNWDGGGGIYLSKDGENWTLVSLQTCPPTSFGSDPEDMNVFYAATSGRSGGVPCDGTFLKSTDSGETWQESVTGLTPEAAGGGLITVEPTPPYRIYLASGASLWISLDKGVTWNETNYPCESYFNSLLFLEGSPNILYAGTGFGLFRSLDGAQTWQRASGALGQLEIWSLTGTAIEDRQILYAASVGGAVDSLDTQTLSLVDVPENLVNAGVYRLTTSFSAYRVNLPLVLR
jgi:photosystem II stability/assembly factor-like uncharacterized protein